MAFRDILTVWLRELLPGDTRSRAGSQPSYSALLPPGLLGEPYFLITQQGFLLLPLPAPCCPISVALPWSYYSHFLCLQCPCSPKCIYSPLIHLAHPNSTNFANFLPHINAFDEIQFLRGLLLIHFAMPLSIWHSAFYRGFLHYAYVRWMNAWMID